MNTEMITSLNTASTTIRTPRPARPWADWLLALAIGLLACLLFRGAAAYVEMMKMMDSMPGMIFS